MKAYRELTRAERQTEYAAVRAAYDNQKAQGLKLNMALRTGKFTIRCV